GVGGAKAELFAGIVQGYEIPRAEVRHPLEYLRKVPLEERARMPGLSADRADIIVAGLTIVDALLRRLEANRIRVHEGGIRDGLLLSIADSGGQSAATGGDGDRADPVAGTRRFARACGYEEAHSLHVADLSLRIFDQMQPDLRRVHGAEFDGVRGRQVLEAAAILHDVGYLINYAAHHKHSYHLIVHANLPGWTSREVQVIANVARYHRCAEPKAGHRTFAVLAKPDQKLVRSLAAILRVADGLDRTHTQRVTGVFVRTEAAAAMFEAVAGEEPGVDLWGGARKSRLFERVFGLTPHFEWRKKPEIVEQGGRVDKTKVLA
ncbi:MAG: HD domain-containing protein, partial [Planctomycetaceae bacterium]|nr:HD domain-containing protein [Planctomycetaceae bacterium]